MGDTLGLLKTLTWRAFKKFYDLWAVEEFVLTEGRKRGQGVFLFLKSSCKSNIIF